MVNDPISVAAPHQNCSTYVETRWLTFFAHLCGYQYISITNLCGEQKLTTNIWNMKAVMAIFSPEEKEKQKKKKKKKKEQ